MIKVIERNTNQAVEIAEAFKNSDADIVIEVKEKTARGYNSDGSYTAKKASINLEISDSGME